MTPVSATDAGVDWRARMWWLAPLCVVASSAIAVTVLMAPKLGAHVAIPRQLVVAAPSPVTQPSVDARSVAAQRPTRRPSPSASPTPSAPASAPTTQVVQPQRPVVTIRDDSRDSGTERGPGDR